MTAEEAKKALQEHKIYVGNYLDVVNISANLKGFGFTQAQEVEKSIVHYPFIIIHNSDFDYVDDNAIFCNCPYPELSIKEYGDILKDVLIDETKEYQKNEPKFNDDVDELPDYLASEDEPKLFDESDDEHQFVSKQYTFRVGDVVKTPIGIGTITAIRQLIKPYYVESDKFRNLFYGSELEYDFQPYDKVLVRDEDDEMWRCSYFSHKCYDREYHKQYCCDATMWNRCIPFKENEHLVGKTKFY